MGFPASWLDMDPPTPLLLLIVVLFASLPLILTLFLDRLGLGVLVAEGPAYSFSWTEYILRHAEGPDDDDATIRLTRCRPRPAPAELIRELLPSSTYAGNENPATPAAASGRCTVCLCELRRGDEVRRPRGCRHVFHRRCLDPWVDLGHRTCPLCRTPLLPAPATAAELGGTCEVALRDRGRYDYSRDDDSADVGSFGFYPLVGDPSDMPSSLALFLLDPPTHRADIFPIAE